MPHHAAALVGFATSQNALQSRMNGAVLLIARQLLHQPPALGFEDYEIPQHVEQRRRRQQSDYQLRLPYRFDAKAGPCLIVGIGQQRLPLDVGLLRRAQCRRRPPRPRNAQRKAGCSRTAQARLLLATPVRTPGSAAAAEQPPPSTRRRWRATSPPSRPAGCRSRTAPGRESRRSGHSPKSPVRRRELRETAW